MVRKVFPRPLFPQLPQIPVAILRYLCILLDDKTHCTSKVSYPSKQHSNHGQRLIKPGSLDTGCDTPHLTCVVIIRDNLITIINLITIMMPLYPQAVEHVGHGSHPGHSSKPTSVSSSKVRQLCFGWGQRWSNFRDIFVLLSGRGPLGKKGARDLAILRSSTCRLALTA